MPAVTLYEILGVKLDATLDEIKRAYRRASRSAHPDRNGGDGAKQQAINDAYAVLSDPERRRRYDLTGLGDRAQDPAAAAKAMLVEELHELLFPRGGGLSQLMQQSIPASDNILKDLSETIMLKRTGLLQGMTSEKTKLGRFEQHIKRVKAKGQETFLIGVIEDAVKKQRELVAHLDFVHRVMQLALKLLAEGYSYEDIKREDVAGLKRLPRYAFSGIGTSSRY
jgi:curved DNA-binding protein CbpA